MFDPLCEEALKQPHQHYDRLRAESPVHFDERLRAWIVSRHADARRILGDHQTFTADPRKVGKPFPDESVSIQVLDPPNYNVVHQILVRAYRAVNWDGLRAGLSKETDSLLREAAYCEAVDVIKRVAVPVAYHAITSLLGIYGLDRDELHDCSTAIVNAMDSGLNPAAAAPGYAARARLTDLVARQYEAGSGEGLIGWMRRHAPADVPTPVIVNTLRAMLHAGYAPVVKLLANAFHALLVSPLCSLTEVCSGHHRHWSREVLRVATPVHAVSRTCAAEMELGGRLLRPNQSVVILLAAANRDPEVFANPHELRLDRDASAALTFGFGPHFCPGASLATLVLEQFLTRIAHRFPATRLLADPEPLRNAVLRGPASLLVRLSPASV